MAEITKRRIEWVDIAKGIAIILVCFGHRDIPKWFTKWIYTFHMPVFFFISGYTTDYSSYKGWKDFLTRKIKGLIVPYLSLGTIFIFIEFVWALIYKRTFFLIGGIHWFVPYIQMLLYGYGIGSSWFIVALFIVEFITFGLSFLPKWKYIITGVLGLFGFYLNGILSEQLLWNINTALIGLLFFEAAQVDKGKLERLLLNHQKSWSVFCVATLLSILCTTFNSQVDMFYRLYGNVIIFLIGSFSGIFILLFLSVKLIYTNIKRLFIYLGCNTLLIIVFHYVQGFRVTETLSWKLFKLQYGNNTFSGNIEGFIHGIAVLLLLLPAIEFFNRFMPWMVGKSSSRRDVIY